MNLLHALRLDHPSTTSAPVISLVGAAGKSTALFQLARQYLGAKHEKVIVSTTTHLGAWQILNADHHLLSKDFGSMEMALDELSGLILITSELVENKYGSPSTEILNWLYERCKGRNIPLLIEADGARERALKAPAEHEPAIPSFSNVVISILGLGILGQTLNEENVHRAEIFSRLSGLVFGQPITPEALVAMLRHPEGGLKNIPADARRIVLLNQADSEAMQSIGGRMAPLLLDTFDSVIVGSLEHKTFLTVEHTAGIILAAGSSTRYGSPKQLLNWHDKPFVRHIAETALQAGLWPLVVVSGAHQTEIEASVKDLNIQVAHNPEHAQGQSSSIKAGLRALPPAVGACIFLLADQPQIPVEVIRALVETHARELPAILAPLVLEERRANPVLFDHVTFPDLLKLEGDIGGRAIFSNYKVDFLPWHDDRLLFDVDEPEDYKRLVENETL